MRSRKAGIAAGRIPHAQNLETDTIGFAFVVARKVELRLNGRVLRTAGGAPGPGWNARRGWPVQWRLASDAGLLLLLEQARWALRDMRDLVTEHGCYFDSLCAVVMSPVCVPMKPPGNAKH